MTKKWQVYPKAPKDFINQFPEYDPLILQLLFNRGITDQRKIDEFFNPDYSRDLFDPSLFKNMERAVARVVKAVKNKERVAVYGDYDADGVTSSVMLTEFFKILGLSGQVYIPDRATEGYGLNKRAIDWLISKKINLIVTCDCGVANKDEIDYAKRKGIEVIVLDHHQPLLEFSNDYIIVDAKQKSDKYPFKELAGCGVVYKFIQAFIKSNRDLIKEEEGFEKWWLDLVAIGTIADCVPLIGPLTSENRTLVKYGLQVLSKTKRLGLQKLMDKAGVDTKSLDTYTLGFVIAPRINSAGRMNHANAAYKLLMAESYPEADRLATELNQANYQRQRLTEQITKEALEKIGEVKPDQKIIFAQKEGWPIGVVGIVAGKIAEEFSRPTFILGKEKYESVGSARSNINFSVIDALSKCSNLLLEYGGHRQAAGFSLKNENVDKFFKQLNKIAGEELKGEDLIPYLKIDAEINLNKIDWTLYDKLKKFEPYGPGNCKPTFVAYGIKVVDVLGVGNGDKHLKMRVIDPNLLEGVDYPRPFDIIGFNFGREVSNIRKYNQLDIVFEIDCDRWNGEERLQLKLIDLKYPK